CIRCMFWFGHYFSFAFISTGNKASQLAGKLQLNNLAQNNWFFSTAENLWIHDLDSGAFKKMQHITSHEMQQHIKQYNYLKIAKKIEGGSLNHLYRQYLDSAAEILL
ncbi:MAG: hypothetical protein ACK4IY_03730, partial [Chitinophagales bacterium]